MGLLLRKYFKVRNFRETKFRDFAIFFGKFVKVWNCEMFDLVALTKVNSRKACLKFFSRKKFFSLKASNYNVYTFLLVPSYPFSTWTDHVRSNICKIKSSKIRQYFNSKNWTVFRTLFYVRYIYPFAKVYYR